MTWTERMMDFSSQEALLSLDGGKQVAQLEGFSQCFHAWIASYDGFQMRGSNCRDDYNGQIRINRQAIDRMVVGRPLARPGGTSPGFPSRRGKRRRYVHRPPAFLSTLRRVLHRLQADLFSYSTSRSEKVVYRVK